MNWHGDGQPEQVWNGYTVFQVKFREEHDTRRESDTEWFIRRVKAELNDWLSPDSKRDPMPDNLVFVTNVHLSSPQGGGSDQAQQILTELLNERKTASNELVSKRAKKVVRWAVWDGRAIDNLVSAYPDVRRGFRSLWTTEDFLEILSRDRAVRTTEEIQGALAEDARKRLLAERYIRLEQSGIKSDGKVLLTDGAIDLPLSSSTDSAKTALREIMRMSDACHNTDAPNTTPRHHIVLVAGPGNGKSTIAQLLAQIYRVAFLSPRDSSGSTYRDAAAAVDAALERLGLTRPQNRRWPFRIDLAKYVDRAGQPDGETGIYRWIASEMSAGDGSAEVKAREIKQWLADWPSLLILDGLDEVTEVAYRRKLIAEIETLIAEAEQDGADLQVVLTTRPTGGEDQEIPEGKFLTFGLGRLAPDAALAFGKQLVTLRNVGDPDQVVRVESRLESAFSNSSLAPFIGTPLQVSIVSFLVQTAGDLPSGRLAVFDGYYEAVLRREIDKPIPLSKVLQKHATHIETLHRQVGFVLQCRSERAAGAAATMPIDEFRRLVGDTLTNAGFPPDSPDVDQILEAATSRLVLLAPREGTPGIGFDVRPIQEMFAAKWITSKEPDLMWSALPVVAASPQHWKDTWLFAVSDVFGRGEASIERLTNLVLTLDDEPPYRLASIVPLSPMLAASIVDDGIADAWPKFLERLCNRAAVMIWGNAPCDPLLLARALLRAASITPELRRTVSRLLDEGDAGSERAREVTGRVRSLVGQVVTELGVDARLHGLSTGSARSSTGVALESSKGEVRETMRRRLDLIEHDRALSADECAALKQVVRLLHTPREPTAVEQAALDTVACNGNSLQALQSALSGDVSPEVARRVRDLIVVRIEREPIGDRVGQILG
ncbi:NACHT domain-containing protein [Demequina sp. SO4-13]|uniref:NACHT domain-containing protein n=1 Tax=Demequina sp. SO4-13 TaxID=3401027 RepID=UPI003AF42952